MPRGIVSLIPPRHTVQSSLMSYGGDDMLAMEMLSGSVYVRYLPLPPTDFLRLFFYNYQVWNSLKKEKFHSLDNNVLLGPFLNTGHKMANFFTTYFHNLKNSYCFLF